jgi:hypothetical protein
MSSHEFEEWVREIAPNADYHIAEEIVRAYKDEFDRDDIYDHMQNNGMNLPARDTY